MKNILRKRINFQFLQIIVNFIFGTQTEIQPQPQIKVVGNIALITEANKNFNLKKLGGVR